MAFPVYILAGGHSTRFGANKALALLNGTPLIAHAAEQFHKSASQIKVIANDPTPYGRLGFPVIPDVQQNLGPMGGLQAACRDIRDAGYFWLAGCDTLLTDSAALGTVADRADGRAQAIAFKGEFWEPLPALYHSSILPAVEAQIAAGERALWRLIERVAHCAVPGPEGLIAHINTPQELELFAARLAKAQAGPSLA